MFISGSTFLVCNLHLISWQNDHRYQIRQCDYYWVFSKIIKYLFHEHYDTTSTPKSQSRLDNRFYRRINAVQFDVRYIATNTEKFNRKGSIIVRHARIVTELCLELIK